MLSNESDDVDFTTRDVVLPVVLLCVTCFVICSADTVLSVSTSNRMNTSKITSHLSDGRLLLTPVSFIHVHVNVCVPAMM